MKEAFPTRNADTKIVRARIDFANDVLAVDFAADRPAPLGQGASTRGAQPANDKVALGIVGNLSTLP